MVLFLLSIVLSLLSYFLKDYVANGNLDRSLSLFYITVFKTFNRVQIDFNEN